MSYSKSRYYSQTQKPIIHSRESSLDSRTSYDSHYSTDTHYSSRTSSMANGYYGGSHSKVVEDRTTKHRVPDNGLYTHTESLCCPSPNSDAADGHYVTSKTSHDDKIVVHDHRSGRTIDEEPRASEARYEDYKDTQKRSSKHRSKR
jgi:hypothetical protein